MYHRDLCNFARQFPRKASEMLEVGEALRRKIREETITDLLMIELKGFASFGIHVDFPADEAKTGQDMDWEFVAPYAKDGRRYFKLHIQAKRAFYAPTQSPYWWYREIDHAVPKGALHGTQHELLINSAASEKACLALYMFYHPASALATKTSVLPAIEGINIMPAAQVPLQTTVSIWPRAEKKVEHWRTNFLGLPDLLCAFEGRKLVKFRQTSDAEPFERLNQFIPTPGEIVDRINKRYLAEAAAHGFIAETSSEIPIATLKALEDDGRIQIKRPRVIFYSGLTDIRADDISSFRR